LLAMNETILAEAEYKKDIQHHFMIIKDKDGVDTSSYEIRMILANQIEGLLPCLIQQLDAQIYYYFEITAGQEFDRAYAGKKLNYQELQNLFVSLSQVLKRLRSFLLDPEHLVLDPHFLYLHAETGTYSFCYLPGYCKDMLEGFRELTEYLLPKIDHQDRDAVTLGYGIYRRAMEDRVTLEQIEEELYGKAISEPSGEDRREREEVDPREVLTQEQETLRREALKSLFDEEDWEQESWWSRLCSWWQERRGKKQKEGKPSQDFTLPKWMEENDREEETICLRHQPEAEPAGQMLCSLHPEQYPDIMLNKDIIFLGKAAGNADAAIPSSAVSRLHARITRKKDQVILIDMRSKNGTRINQSPLVPDQEYELHHGDMVEFADVGYQCKF
jgi:hypothetical protein